ncbi:TBC domain-containing protein kinase-like protein [Macrosteles quadrilineatus]|uniref:TBC domain-containing protein kinase-like protein n=1 Tax=Macrosteles quadrilineatus TaxID=74068 RepID=UPI0023E3480F|nr:TBC domain-containing protein kinase-like protein [Macrosteles quadrilineatus]
MASTAVAPQFVGSTFFAMRHSGELCGSNGLPLTPNSITILGRSQYLKTLTHPNLCSYLDVMRGKHERSIVVCEYHGRPLHQAYPPVKTLPQIVKLAKEVLEGLSYLNSKGLVHRGLCPDNILINDEGRVQLFNYGLYYMTGAGTDVMFPIGSPKYTAPEVFLLQNSSPSSGKTDVWSLGIVLAELVLGQRLWANLNLGQTLRKVLSLLHCDTSTLERLARETDRLAVLQSLPEDVVDLINLCLQTRPRLRPTAAQLLDHRVFSQEVMEPQVTSPTLAVDQRVKNWKNNLLSERPLQELYYLWRLAGGDLHTELKKQGLVRNKAPILSLPNLILLEGTLFGQSRDQATMLDLRVVPLPLDTLVQRLSQLPLTAYYPLTETKSSIILGVEEQSDAASLPLVIRERDTEYQFHRVVLCDRLLKGYPYKKAAILKEAHKDIPPLYRGELWSVLLGVVGDIETVYRDIDKETLTATDRQIEVDIPRCHQYNELLSSREGHRKLKRVLKAWVVSHPQYVYWQGLDSLCAPFLFLNFNNEARAYVCLSAFIPKYLHNFFLKDNSAVIREYLLKFSQLITFHDPVLSKHLQEINFIPELFAIPWFLTMFSHVFPLHKIFHLWDKLLLGDASFPLYVGLAILQQLRDTLLSSGFNECILLFSDLPEVDIERCVTDCIELYCSTPRSVTHREHELQNTNKSANTELELTGVTLAELQSEVSPRISGADLIELLSTKFSRPKVFVVDIRRREDYSEGAIPGSVNIPLSTVDLASDSSISLAVPESPELSLLCSNKGKIIVVGGDTMTDATKCYDLASDSSINLAVPESPELSLLCSNKGKIIVVGGDTMTDATKCYDLASDSSISLAVPESPELSLLCSNKGKIIVVAGDTITDATKLHQSESPELSLLCSNKGKIIVVGGDTMTDATKCYDLASDNSISLAVPESPELSLLCSNKGKIIVVGGDTMTNATKCYDLASDNSISLAVPESPELSLLCSNKGKIIVVGGDTMTDATKCYDLASDSSISLAVPESPELSLLCSNKGKIIVVGGDTMTDATKSNALYDTVIANQEQLIANRQGTKFTTPTFTAAVMTNLSNDSSISLAVPESPELSLLCSNKGKIIVVGGDTMTDATKAKCYDLASDSSISLAVPESPELSLLCSNKGKIIVVGGDTMTDATKCYDLASDSSISLAVPESPELSLLCSNKGKIIVVGGDTMTDATKCYDLASDSSISLAVPESPELSLLCSNKGKIIVVGGDTMTDATKVSVMILQVTAPSVWQSLRVLN